MGNVINGNVPTEEAIKGNLNSAVGFDGKSAYELAVKNGFEGTEAEWVASLKGDPFVFEDFTIEQLASLKGEQGISGVYVGSGDMPEQYNVQIDPNGETITLDDCVTKEEVNELRVDYIIEQGTSGIWTYRKWASGVAECWGISEKLYITSFDAQGTIYSSGILQNSNIDLPFEFKETPYVDISIHFANHSFWGTKSVIETTTTTQTGGYILYRTSNMENFLPESVYCYLGYSVKGKWEQGGI